jgi:pyruvate dehydrogenase E1 component beta subunit
MLWGLKEDVQDGEFNIPFGVARTVRAGTDVTIVGISTGVHVAMQAAAKLEAEGISAEVIDPRTMVPLDSDASLNSVARTGRLVIVDPAHTTCSAAAEISAIVAEKAFDCLKAPIVRATTPDTQIPFSPAIEKQLYPDAAKTLAAVHKMMASRARSAA